MTTYTNLMLRTTAEGVVMAMCNRLKHAIDLYYWSFQGDTSVVHVTVLFVILC